MFNKLTSTLIGLFIVIMFTPAYAGLDLNNQKEISIDWLDINLDGRVTREEVGKYLFFYFDHDGNESLSRGEYRKAREMTFLPYDGDRITFVDIDHDGLNDGTDLTAETFTQKAVVGEYDPDEGLIAKEILDEGYLKADSDRSKYIELDEWQKIYKKHAAKRGNLPPKAANEDSYSR